MTDRLTTRERQNGDLQYFNAFIDGREVAYASNWLHGPLAGAPGICIYRCECVDAEYAILFAQAVQMCAKKAREWEAKETV